MNQSIKCNITDISNSLQQDIVSQYTYVYLIQRVVTWINLAIGIPSNILSLIAWGSGTLYHQNTFLVIILVISDFGNIMRLLINYRHISSDDIKYSATCNLIPIFDVFVIYSNNFLILLLTLERLVLIKWPNKAYSMQDYVKVCIIIAVISFLMSAQEGVFHVYARYINSTNNNCYLTYKFDEVNLMYSRIHDILKHACLITAFIITPIIVFLIDLIIVAIICRLKYNDQEFIETTKFKTSTLLIVSFFFVALSTPYIVTYPMAGKMDNGPLCLSKEEVYENQHWRSVFSMYYRQMISLVLFDFFYSTKFFIYFLTIPLFRTALMDKWEECKKIPSQIKNTLNNIKRSFLHIKAIYTMMEKLNSTPAEQNNGKANLENIQTLVNLTNLMSGGSNEVGPNTVNNTPNPIANLLSNNPNIGVEHAHLLSKNPNIGFEHAHLLSNNPNIGFEHAHLLSNNPNIGVENAHLLSNNPNVEVKNAHLLSNNPNIEVENAHLLSDNPNIEVENAHILSNNPNIEVENAHLLSNNPNVEVENAHLLSNNPSIEVENAYLLSNNTTLPLLETKKSSNTAINTPSPKANYGNLLPKNPNIRNAHANLLSKKSTSQSSKKPSETQKSSSTHLNAFGSKTNSVNFLNNKSKNLKTHESKYNSGKNRQK